MTTASAPQAKLPTVARILVTPTMAANWLDNANSRNRPISQAVVERYCRDMRASR